MIGFVKKSIGQAPRDPIEQNKLTGEEHHRLIGLTKPILNLMGRVEIWRAAIRFGLSVSAPFGLRCLTSQSMRAFPDPASSNRTCGFPASGFRQAWAAFAHG